MQGQIDTHEAAVKLKPVSKRKVQAEEQKQDKREAKRTKREETMEG